MVLANSCKLWERKAKFLEITILDSYCNPSQNGTQGAIKKCLKMGWNSDLYDTKHDFVSRYGEKVLTLLGATAGERILDLGCGTGDLTELIHRKGALVVGIDRSKEMIASAKEKYPHLDFKVAAVEKFSCPVEFDAIFSNAVLHWVLQKEEAIKCMCGALKNQGRLVVEFGGKGNVESIVRSLKKALEQIGALKNAQKVIWYFPSLSEYTTLLEKNGFRVLYAIHFDRKTELKEDQGIEDWIKMFGQSYLQGLQEDEIKMVLGMVRDDLAKTNYKNGKWYADYKRLRVLAIKE